MEKINVAILGAGHIAESMAKALAGIQEHVSMYAVASRTLSKAREFAGKWGFRKAYGSYEELAKDDKVDLIYVATPHSEHYQNTRFCLMNGRNCLVEKAFCANLKQAEELVALAKKRNLYLAEAIWTRYLPSKNEIKSLLESGVIGAVKSVETDFSVPIIGVERLVNPALAGGALLDLGVYSLTALAMYMTGNISKISIESVLTDGGVDATDSVTFTYSDGAIAKAACSFVNGPSNYARITGDKGYLEFSPINAPESVRVYDLCGKLLQSIDIKHIVNGYEYEVLESRKRILEGHIEAESMPLSETLRIMGRMDSIRSHIGMIYPFETKEDIAISDTAVWGTGDVQARVTRKPL